jgi:hypothetical protein
MVKDSLKIYLAGPYTAKTDKGRFRNVITVIDVAIEIFRKGHYPYVPHLTHFVDKRTKKLGVRLNWNDYMRWHNEWLGLCDAFLFIKSSKGANLELKKAKKLGKKIFYSIESVPSVNNKVSSTLRKSK